MPLTYRRFLLLLISIYAAFWGLLAIAPRDRSDWLLENALVLVCGLVLGAWYRQFRFSRTSYLLIFLFLCLHAVGAHYTYSEVPYDEALRRLGGGSLNELLGWRRNNFDRVVHFCYGLLFAYPLREVFLRVAQARGFWGYLLPLDFTLSTSALYELIEWGAAEFFGGDLGVAYLGTQGDVWDAHKDMALAGAGAMIAMLLTAAANAWMQRDFAREWSDSLREQPRSPKARPPAATSSG